MNRKLEIKMGSERVIISFGIIERIGFVGGIVAVAMQGTTDFGQELWALCALFAFLGVATFKKSSINMCMPERLMFLGFFGFLGFLGYIPGMGFLKGLFGFYGFFGFAGFLGLPKKHFYSVPDETTNG
jgi:hypothetical protein